MADMAEEFFIWLLDVDPCSKKHYVSDLLEFCNAPPSRLSPQVITDLDALHSRTLHLKARNGVWAAGQSIEVTCRCQPRKTMIKRDVPNIPRDVSGHLYPESNAEGYWPFDYDPQSEANRSNILQWVLKRLAEYIWHHTAPHPYATFPSAKSIATSRSWARLLPAGLLPDKHVFGMSVPILHLQRPISFHGGPMVRLLKYSKPDRMEMTDLRYRWLSYLYRGPIPDGRCHDFPPLTCSIITMFLGPQLDATAAQHLWGVYKKCDIEVSRREGWIEAGYTPPCSLRDRKPCLLQGINGITVAFCAAPPSRINLFIFPEVMDVILSDLLRNGAIWLLCNKRESLKDLLELCLGRVYFTATNSDTCSLNAALPSVCRRVSLIFKAWLHRPIAPYSLLSTPLSFQEILQDIGALGDRNIEVPTSTRIQVFAGSMVLNAWREQRTETMECQWRTYHVAAFGILRGCAVGTVANIMMERIEARQEASRRMEFRLKLVADVIKTVMGPLTGLSGFAATPELDTTVQMLTESLNRRLGKANRQDFAELKTMLQVTRDTLLQQLDSYSGTIDRDFMYRHFCQALTLTVAGSGTEEAGTREHVPAMFDPSNTSLTWEPLVSNRDTRFEPEIAHMLFHDLSRTRIVHRSHAQWHDLLMRGVNREARQRLLSQYGQFRWVFTEKRAYELAALFETHNRQCKTAMVASEKRSPPMIGAASGPSSESPSTKSRDDLGVHTENDDLHSWPKLAQVTDDYTAGPELHLKARTQIYVELGKSRGSYRFTSVEDDNIKGVRTGLAPCKHEMEMLTTSRLS